MIPWVAAWVFLMTLAQLAAAEPAHDLFTGQNVSAAGGRVARFACHTCHGRDGRGGVEGNVPAIAGDALRVPTDLRPAYDFDAFRHAVGAGIDASGRKLSRIMPRYDLTDAELALLWDYVAELPVRQAWGVTAHSIRLGVIITADQPEIGQRYLRRLQDEMAQAFPSGKVYGRRIEIIGMADPTKAANQVLAAIAMPAGHQDLTTQLTKLGLPVLFPLTGLVGVEDPSIQRGFTPTDRAVNGAIARHLAETSAKSIAVIADTARADALAHMIRLEVQGAKVWRVEPGTASTPDAPDAIVNLTGSLPQALATHTMLYQLASRPIVEPAPLSEHRHFLVIEAPDLINLAIGEGLHPLEAHAVMTARVLAAALVRAGRDLSRSSLLSELAQADLGPQGLDYARLPLAGTEYVQIITLHSDQ